jgi:hypothetical protein
MHPNLAPLTDLSPAAQIFVTRRARFSVHLLALCAAVTGNSSGRLLCWMQGCGVEGCGGCTSHPESHSGKRFYDVINTLQTVYCSVQLHVELIHLP